MAKDGLLLTTLEPTMYKTTPKQSQVPHKPRALDKNGRLYSLEETIQHSCGKGSESGMPVTIGYCQPDLTVWSDRE